MADITRQVQDGVARALEGHDSLRAAKLRSAKDGMTEAIRNEVAAKRQEREEGIRSRLFDRRVAELRGELPMAGDIHLGADGSERRIESVSRTHVRLDDGSLIPLRDVHRTNE